MMELRRDGEFKFVHARNGLAGWIWKGLPLGLLGDFSCNPEGVFHAPAAAFLKNGSKTQVLKHTFCAGEGKSWNLIIKRVYYRSRWRRMRSFFVSPPALRSLNSALKLTAWGFLTPRPLAALVNRGWGDSAGSYYLVEEVEGTLSLPALWTDAPPALPKKQVFRKKRRILKSLASLFYQLHSAGIYHQDLKGGNILIRECESEDWQCYLIDIEGVRKYSTLRWSRRVKNLVQLYRTFGEHLNIREKACFLKRYAELSSMSSEQRKALAAQIIAMNNRWGKPLC